MEHREASGNFEDRDVVEELRLAVLRGNLQIVENILDSGVSVNQTLKGGWTPLLISCSMANPEMVTYLLRAGADPNFHKELFTPLMAVCGSRKENEDNVEEVVRALLTAGARLDATERHGLTAMMFAAKEGRTSVLDILLDHGPDLEIRDNQGWTALFWAVNQGKVNTVAFLVRNGAVLETKDRKGQTVFDIANMKGMNHIADVIKRKGELEPHDKTTKDDNVLCEALLSELANLANNNRSKFGVTEIDKILSLLSEGKFHGREDIMEKKKMINSLSLDEASEAIKMIIKRIEGLQLWVSEVRMNVEGRGLGGGSWRPPEPFLSLLDKASHKTFLLHQQLRFFHTHVEDVKVGEIILTKTRPAIHNISALFIIATVSFIVLKKLKFISFPLSLHF